MFNCRINETDVIDICIMDPPKLKTMTTSSQSSPTMVLTVLSRDDKGNMYRTTYHLFNESKCLKDVTHTRIIEKSTFALLSCILHSLLLISTSQHEWTLCDQ